MDCMGPESKDHKSPKIIDRILKRRFAHMVPGKGLDPQAVKMVGNGPIQGLAGEVGFHVKLYGDSKSDRWLCICFMMMLIVVFCHSICLAILLGN